MKTRNCPSQSGVGKRESGEYNSDGEEEGEDDEIFPVEQAG